MWATLLFYWWASVHAYNKSRYHKDPRCSQLRRRENNRRRQLFLWAKGYCHLFIGCVSPKELVVQVSFICINIPGESELHLHWVLTPLKLPVDHDNRGLF